MCEKGAGRSEGIRALHLFYVPGQRGIIRDGTGILLNEVM